MFRSCEYNPVTSVFTLDFEYNVSVSVQGAEFYLDEQGFLVINFQSAVLTFNQLRRELQNGVLRFVYQNGVLRFVYQKGVEIWHKT